MHIIKKVFNFIIRVAISLVLMFLLFHVKKIDTHSFLADIKASNKGLLLIAFVISLINYFLCFLRWEMLVKAANIHLSKKRLLTSFSGGIFFSLFLPSTIGGDVARSIDLSKFTKKPREVTATVLLDRLSGFVGLVILVLVSLSLGFNLVKDNFVVLLSCAILFSILVISLLVLFNKYLFSKIRGFLDSPKRGKTREMFISLYQEIHYFQKHKGVLLKNLGISLLIQTISPVAFYITALSLGVNQVSPLYFFIFTPIIGAITLLPISIGGFGLRENIAVILFSKTGIEASSVAAMALLNSFFILLIGIIGGIIYVLTVHHRRI